ncbi:hypothetical protein L3X38_001274 [Prunus dulcis]|uniref:RING-type E3 ubiquitin transferase n=1 Tax=Prunus dulcis TaxID=3755 RepID=A0AAD4WTS2_PRUDU|nr:hypothetical protein L3X38_001274 [Prunus dulcis]
MKKKLSLNSRVEEEEGSRRERMSNIVDNGNHQGVRTIAVAVDEGIASQNALKWAVNHLLYGSTRHTPIKLLHVINPSNSKNTPHATGQAHEAQNMDFMLPFRCYCTRKRVQCETVVLEDQDVAEALLDYISRNGIEFIVLGATATSRIGFSRRLFKASESIPGRVLKLAPHFCSVYTIKQGRVCEGREASRPLPNIRAADERAEESNHVGRAPSNRAYDEVSLPDNDISLGRPSTDSISFYQNFGSADMSRVLSESSNYLESIAKLESDFGSFDLNIPHELSSNAQGMPFLSQKVLDEMEDEMKRLRVELKQTMDMYHAACKEAVAAKQKAIELEEWKMKEGQRLEETRRALEATLAAMEKERANSKATILAADGGAAEQFADKELQRTINADQIFKALREANDEEKKRVLDALGQSHIVFKYQSLVHILVVLFFFSLYYSLF